MSSIIPFRPATTGVGNAKTSEPYTYEELRSYLANDLNNENIHSILKSLVLNNSITGIKLLDSDDTTTSFTINDSDVYRDVTIVIRVVEGTSRLNILNNSYNLSTGGFRYSINTEGVVSPRGTNITGDVISITRTLNFKVSMYLIKTLNNTVIDNFLSATTSINSINNRVTRVSTDVESNKQNIGTYTNVVDTSGILRNDSLETKISKLRQLLTTLEDGDSDSFLAIRARFNNLRSRADAVDSLITTNSDNITTNTAAIAAISSNDFTPVNNLITNLTTRVTSNEDDIEDLEIGISSLTTRVNNLPTGGGGGGGGGTVDTLQVAQTNNYLGINFVYNASATYQSNLSGGIASSSSNFGSTTIGISNITLDGLKFVLTNGVDVAGSRNQFVAELNLSNFNRDVNLFGVIGSSSASIIIYYINQTLYQYLENSEDVVINSTVLLTSTTVTLVNTVTSNPTVGDYDLNYTNAIDDNLRVNNIDLYNKFLNIPLSRTDTIRNTIEDNNTSINNLVDKTNTLIDTDILRINEKIGSGDTIPNSFSPSNTIQDNLNLLNFNGRLNEKNLLNFRSEEVDPIYISNTIESITPTDDVQSIISNTNFSSFESSDVLLPVGLITYRRNHNPIVTIPLTTSLSVFTENLGPSTSGQESYTISIRTSATSSQIGIISIRDLDITGVIKTKIVNFVLYRNQVGFITPDEVLFNRDGGTITNLNYNIVNRSSIAIVSRTIRVSFLTNFNTLFDIDKTNIKAFYNRIKLFIRCRSLGTLRVASPISVFITNTSIVSDIGLLYQNKTISSIDYNTNTINFNDLPGKIVYIYIVKNFYNNNWTVTYSVSQTRTGSLILSRNLTTNNLNISLGAVPYRVVYRENRLPSYTLLEYPFNPYVTFSTIVIRTAQISNRFWDVNIIPLQFDNLYVMFGFSETGNTVRFNQPIFFRPSSRGPLIIRTIENFLSKTPSYRFTPTEVSSIFRFETRLDTNSRFFPINTTAYTDTSSTYNTDIINYTKLQGFKNITFDSNPTSNSIPTDAYSVDKVRLVNNEFIIEGLQRLI